MAQHILDWDIPEGYDGVVEITIPYLNPEMNDSLVHEGYVTNSDAIDNGVIETINEYLKKHIATDQNFMFIKLKWDLDLREWSWEYNRGDSKLELWFDYIGKDEDSSEHIDQAMDWLCSQHTMEINPNNIWDNHIEVQEQINEVWMDNWVSCEDPCYPLKLLQNDVLITDSYSDIEITNETTQEEIQTHINQIWLVDHYSTDDYADDQKELVDYCKQRWGYTVKIPQKEVA